MIKDPDATINNRSLYNLRSKPGFQFSAQIFDVYDTKMVIPFDRRDYYKVWIVTARGKIRYANETIIIDRPALIFSNPLIPYTYETDVEQQPVWLCFFTEGFIRENDRLESLQRSTLFKAGGNHVFFLNEKQLTFLTGIFEQMVEENNSSYPYKMDVLRNYVNLVLHEALKMDPAPNSDDPHNASSRIANLFLDLLELQFPVDADQHVLKLRKANDFAETMAIHVNHLNHTVKEITGKSTTEHITERIIHEAKALLKYSDWSINAISHSLGFDYITYFNTVFKKKTGTTPLTFRKQLI